MNNRACPQPPLPFTGVPPVAAAANKANGKVDFAFSPPARPRNARAGCEAAGRAGEGRSLARRSQPAAALPARGRGGERGPGSLPGGPRCLLRAGPRPGSLSHCVVGRGEGYPAPATTKREKRDSGRSGIVMAALGGGGCPGVRPVGRRGFRRAGRGERAQLLPRGLRRAGARSGEPAWPCLRPPAPRRRSSEKLRQG